MPCTSSVPSPGSRPGEHGFEDDRATQELPQVDGNDREHREHGVLQGVADHHHALAQALCTSRAQKVLLQYVEHARATHPRDERGLVQPQGKTWQHKVAADVERVVQPPNAGDRQYLPIHGEQDDQKNAQEERRSAHSYQSQRHARVVQQRVLPNGSQHAKRKPNGHPYEQGDDGQLQREWEVRDDPLPN
jgi:hypothetical protein